jgi:hypothetical protein
VLPFLRDITPRALFKQVRADAGDTVLAKEIDHETVEIDIRVVHDFGRDGRERTSAGASQGLAPPGSASRSAAFSLRSAALWGGRALWVQRGFSGVRVRTRTGLLLLRGAAAVLLLRGAAVVLLLSTGLAEQRPLFGLSTRKSAAFFQHRAGGRHRKMPFAGFFRASGIRNTGRR